MRKDVLNKCHRILKDKNNKWSTMIGGEKNKTSETKWPRRNLHNMPFDLKNIKL